MLRIAHRAALLCRTGTATGISEEREYVGVEREDPYSPLQPNDSRMHRRLRDDVLIRIRERAGDRGAGRAPAMMLGAALRIKTIGP
jgi:hypothetical protein